MTQLKDNMSDIDKIRQEIARLRKEIKDDKDPLAPNQKAGYLFALADMESFLNTFSKETYKDSLQVHETCKENTDSFTSLEEAAEEYAIPFNDTTYGCEYSYKGFIAGAKWHAKQLLKGSPLPEDTVLFQKGVEEGRRLERDDLALSIDDIEKIHVFLYAVKNNKQGVFTFTRLSDEQYKEVLRRFKEAKK